MGTLEVLWWEACKGGDAGAERGDVEVGEVAGGGGSGGGVYALFLVKIEGLGFCEGWGGVAAAAAAAHH